MAEPSISMGETPNSPTARETSGLNTRTGATRPTGTKPGNTEIPPPAEQPARPPAGPREDPGQPNFDNPPPDVPHPGEAPTGPGPVTPGPTARKPEEWPGG